MSVAEKRAEITPGPGANAAPGGSNTPAQLLSPTSAESIYIAIAELCEIHGEPALICIDTVARNFGSGDENSTADMSRFIANIDQYLRRPFTACVMLVHHMGKNESGARGSSALTAACDTHFKVTRDETGAVELACDRQKDGATVDPISLYLCQVELDGLRDNFGSIVTSRVVLPRVAAELTGMTVSRGPNQLIAINELKRLLAEHGDRLEADGRERHHAVVLTTDWRSASMKSIGGKYARSRFNEVRKELEEEDVVHIDGPHVFLR